MLTREKITMMETTKAIQVSVLLLIKVVKMVKVSSKDVEGLISRHDFIKENKMIIAELIYHGMNNVEFSWLKN